MQPDLIFPGYDAFLQEIKAQIQHAQQRAVLAVNQELMMLYWQIGNDILKRQQELGWGAKVIDRLAADLRSAFPSMKGFSPRNLKYMRSFATTYPDETILQQMVAKMSWSHYCALLDRVKDTQEREWYIEQAAINGWSRNVLVHQIEGDLYHRQGQAITNFARTLPSPQSDLAQQMLKDPYLFDFLALGAEMQERDLEHGLLNYIRDFLLESGGSGRPFTAR
jgi:predicted nuclease of restriction endonuclease-like (RecB) superfamily